MPFYVIRACVIELSFIIALTLAFSDYFAHHIFAEDAKSKTNKKNYFGNLNSARSSQGTIP